MKIYQFVYTILLLFSVLMLSGCKLIASSLPSGVTPVQATWLYGRYVIPAKFLKDNKTNTFHQGVSQPLWTKLATARIKPGVKIPVVLYLHGCKGLSKQADHFSDLLLAEGYAVFMPDSFQRPGRRQCRDEGELYERVWMRNKEVDYALEQISMLPWVDQNRLLLMGYSEGGNVADNWSKPGFAAHLVMGSACTLVGGKPAAPEGTPVLAIVSARDQYRPGESCRIDESDGISKSIVLQGASHSVIQYSETQNAIRTFVRKCCPKQDR